MTQKEDAPVDLKAESAATESRSGSVQLGRNWPALIIGFGIVLTLSWVVFLTWIAVASFSAFWE